MTEKKIICAKCNEEMVLMERNLDYIGRRITYSFPSCPKCNAIYIPRELVESKIHEIETSLEDK